MNQIISVIVPIYNGEKYIQKMLKSLVEQTYPYFEVFLVEDHSTDNSKTIISEFCRNDERFKLLEPQEKMGTAVRGQEYALPYCNGEYHFYLSQDDFLDKDFFEKCIEVFDTKKADVAIPNCILYDAFSNKKLGEYPLNNDYEHSLNNHKAFELSLDWKIHGFTMEKMSLFKKVGLKATYYNSDEYYKRILFLEAKGIYFVDSNFYYRQDNPNAITKGIKYIHIDVLTTDFLLYRRLSRENYDKLVCKKHIKKIVSEYRKWIVRGFKYRLFFGNNGYFFSSLIRLFLPIEKERIKLVFRR